MHTMRAIHAAATKPEGIAFCLECGEKTVHGLVTRAALIFLAGCFLLERDYEMVFEISPARPLGSNGWGAIAAAV